LKNKREIKIAWWKCGEAEDEQTKMANTIFDLLATLQDDQADRHDKNLRCARLYGNIDYVGLGPYAYTKPQTSNSADSRVKYNIISSMVGDAAADHVSHDRRKVVGSGAVEKAVAVCARCV
jgi:hypothetical protein